MKRLAPVYVPLAHARHLEPVDNTHVNGVWVYWICECGHDGIDVDGDVGACPGCHRLVRASLDTSSQVGTMRPAAIPIDRS